MRGGWGGGGGMCWNSATLAPGELGLHKTNGVPSIPQDKDPQGKTGLLPHCAGPTPLV